MTDSTPWRRDAQGRLDEDVPCRDCGYSLRGLELEGNCPECHAPVRRSVHAELLRFADPGWLKRVAWGTGLMAVAIPAMVPATGAALVAADGDRVGAALVLALATTVPVVAVWLATAPEPAHVERRPISRPAARVSLLCGILLAAALLQALAADWWPPALHRRGPALVLADGALFLIGLLALGSWGRSLALRLPADRLARRIRIVTWCFVVAVPLEAIATAAREGLHGGAPRLEGALVAVAVLGRISAMVFGLIALVLMAVSVRELVAAARRAQDAAVTREGSCPADRGPGATPGAAR